MDPKAWSRSEARAVVLRVHRAADALLAEHGCERSAGCCRFARTGREPSVTIGEWLEVRRAVAASGRRPPGPPMDPDRTCPYLSRVGRCTIYEARPFGCRTYFCHRVRGPVRIPREELQGLVKALEAVAASLRPEDPAPRTLSSWLRSLGGRGRKKCEGGASRVGGARDQRHPRSR